MKHRITVYRRRYTATRADGRPYKKLADFYTIEFKDIDGKIKREPGYPDKLASQRKADDIRRRLANGLSGLDAAPDVYAQYRDMPLAQHIDDYLRDPKKEKKPSAKYAQNFRNRMNRLAKDCGWQTLFDITEDAFAEWRDQPIQRKESKAFGGVIGPRTANQYLQVVRALCRWAVKRKRLPTNPFTDIETLIETTDVRRGRRSMTEEEWTALLNVVADEHQAVYRFIFNTGMRRREVALLQWSDVRLDDAIPHVKLRAITTKSKKSGVIPLHDTVIPELRHLRGSAADGDRVFAEVPSITIHKNYLAAAKIKWQDADGRRLDIHALRTSSSSILTSTGAMPVEVMALMRHADIKTTMKNYTDSTILKLSTAVNRLPIPARTLPTGKPVDSENGCVDSRVENSELGVSQDMPGVAQHAQPIDNATSSASHDTSSQAERVGIEPTSDRENGPTAVLKTAGTTRNPALSGISGVRSQRSEVRRHSQEIRAT